MLKNRTTYEIMNPQDVGWEGTKLVVGKHSGRAGFKNALQELGIKLDDEQLQAAYLRFLELADRKKHVTSADLEALVSDQLQSEGDAYHLMQWKVDIASGEPATATVVLGSRRPAMVGEAEGNGPVDAILRAIDAASGHEPSWYYVRRGARYRRRTRRARYTSGFAMARTFTPARVLHRTSSRRALGRTSPR